jgi:spoIIIJ-associated protein
MSDLSETSDVDEAWDDPEPSDTEHSSDDDDVEGDDEARADDRDAGDGDGDGDQRPRRRSRRKNGQSNKPYEAEDDRQRLALEFLTDVIDHMEMDCDVALRRPRSEEGDDIQLEVEGRDAGRIIGKKGQVLAALQFLCNRVVNRPGLDRRHVTVDAEGYRHRRESSLATMARRLGKQAVTDGKIITFEPMNPRDRRVVHLALAKFEGVVTKSEGEGQSRRVQIIPVRR